MPTTTSAPSHSLATETDADDNDVQVDNDNDEVLEDNPTIPEDLDYHGVRRELFRYERMVER